MTLIMKNDTENTKRKMYSTNFQGVNIIFTKLKIVILFLVIFFFFYLIVFFLR